MPKRSHSERRAAFKIRYSEGDEPIPGYRLIKRLGQGGVGQVFKAIGPGGVAVALKIISGLDEAGGRKELRALQNVKNIGHANLVAIYGFWLKDEDGNIVELNEAEDAQPGHDSSALRPAQLFIVMRLCDEGSLFDRLQECKKKGLGGIPEEELIGYCEDAARAIDYLNTRCNMQHCDIKPQNILIVGGTAQVCDYGLLKEVDDPHRSTNMVSPLYAAPELLPMTSRDPGPSHATDQCSLAMSYVELRTGRLPFGASVNPDNPFQVMQAVACGDLDFSALVDAERKVITRATAIDPGQRYESCVKMVRDLRRAVEGAGTDANAAVETRPLAPAAPFRSKYQEGDEAVPGYRLIKRLRADGRDELFLASGRDASNVSLKIIYDLDEVTARQELQFLQKMRDIRHPYLVPVYGAWLKYDDGALVDHSLSPDEMPAITQATKDARIRPLRRAQVLVATQICEGTLSDRMHECQQIGLDGIPRDELAGYLEEAARAIDYLNTVHGVAHRDIKPQNILLVGGVALVGNFGLARKPYDPRRGFDEAFPSYAAPELLPRPGSRVEATAGLASDLYSLAVSYCELQTGRLPLDGSLPGELLAAVMSGRLDLSRLSSAEQRVLATATSRDPTQRYSSAVQMVRELRAAIAEQAKEEASAKSSLRSKTVLVATAVDAPSKILSPFKARYEEGDEPIPGYKLVERLGSAGVDEVFQAVGPDDEKLALKIRYQLDEPEARAELRFLQRMASVRHPHLVAIDEIWLKTENGEVIGPNQLGDDPLPDPTTPGSRPPRSAQLYVAMPLCDGNLHDRLVETQRSKRVGIPPDELLGYMEESAKAVDFLNSVLGLQHCNLKPRNILLLGGIAQLGDLSSNRSPIDTRGTAEMLVPFYAPPELLPVSEDDPAPAATSDQYSLAMCYVELRTGRLPLCTQDVIESMVAISAGDIDLAALPESERKIVGRALSLKPADRFPSATAMVRALRRAVEGAATGSSGTQQKPLLRAPFQPRYAEGDEPIPGYRLLERIGVSGHNEVFRAAGPGARKVALKIAYGLDEETARRDFRLLQRVKEIRHSHLIDIDDIWLKNESGALFDQHTLAEAVTDSQQLDSKKPRGAQLLFSMPLSEGNLAEFLKEFQKQGEPGIPSHDLVGYFEAAAKAIDHLNNVHGLAHRAISPQHLLVQGGAVRLSDFGLSENRPLGQRLSDPEPPYYLAPELLANGEPPPPGTLKSDIYALAMSYVQLRTGKLPFASADPAQVARAAAEGELDLAHLAPAEVAVIGRALSRRKERRYDSAGEMVRALRQALPAGTPGVTVAEVRGDAPVVRYPIKNKYVKGDEPVPGHRLLELIGRGGFGDVWKASPPGGIHEVALKIVYDAGGQLGQRELIGLWQIKKITHENMVPIQGLWIKDAQGNLVDNEQIASLERELAAEVDRPPPGEPGKSDAPLAAANLRRGTLGRTPHTTLPPGATRLGKGDGTVVPAENGGHGTLMFDHLRDAGAKSSSGSAVVDSTLLAEVGALLGPARRTFQPAQLFIAMQLCDGHLLHTLTKYQEKGLAGIPAEELLRHIDAAAEVIDQFNLEHHTRHLDIKPQNLLTIGKSLKVCDFGLVRKSKGEHQGPRAYTPEYAAPEQVQGGDSPTTDQYCLAVSYFHLRTGVLPFKSSGTTDIIAGKKQTGEAYDAFLDLTKVSRREREVVQRALALDPPDRYRSCKEFSAALREAVFGSQAVAPPRKSSWLLPALTAAVLLLLLGAVSLAIMMNKPPTQEQLIGTIVEVDGDASKLIVRDQEQHDYPVTLTSKTYVILNREEKTPSALRREQIVKVWYVRGRPADRIEAKSPPLPAETLKQLDDLVAEGKLKEAFEAAARSTDPAGAESHVKLEWLRRSQKLVPSGKPAALRKICAEAFLVAARFPDYPAFGDQRREAVEALFVCAAGELEYRRPAEADACYSFVWDLLDSETVDVEVALWQRTALLGLLRTRTQEEPADLAPLWDSLLQFDALMESHAALLPADQFPLKDPDRRLLASLRVIDAALGPPASLAARLSELMEGDNWRLSIPSGWQSGRIEKLCERLADELEQGTILPELREPAARLLNFDGILARASAKLSGQPPNFALAKSLVELARQKAEGDPQKLARVQAALAEISLIDLGSSDAETGVALVRALQGFDADAPLPAKLLAAIESRTQAHEKWLAPSLVDALIGELGRLDKGGGRGAEFDKAYSLVAAHDIVNKYAVSHSYEGDLLKDYPRVNQSDVKLPPRLRATLNACWVEFKLAGATPTELPVLHKLAVSAGEVLAGEGEFASYAAFVRAASGQRSDPQGVLDAARLVAQAWRSPVSALDAKALDVKERKATGANILIAAAERLLESHKDASFGMLPASGEGLATTKAYLAQAGNLLGKEDISLTGPSRIALLAIVEDARPPWQAVQRRSDELLADVAVRETIGREGWLGRLYLTSALAHLDNAQKRSQPASLATAVARSASALELLTGSTPDPRRIKAICEQVLTPVLTAAGEPGSNTQIDSSAWAALLAAKGKFLKNNSQLKAILAPGQTSPYVEAFRAYSQAAALEPTRVDYLVGKAYTWEDLPRRDQLASNVDLRRLIADAQSVSGARDHAGVHGLVGKLAIDDSRKQPLVAKRKELLEQAIVEYQEALRLAPPRDEEVARYYLGLSYANLEFAFFKSIRAADKISHLEEAAKQAESATKVDPPPARLDHAWIAWGNALEDMAHYVHVGPDEEELRKTKYLEAEQKFSGAIDVSEAGLAGLALGRCMYRRSLRCRWTDEERKQQLITAEEKLQEALDREIQGWNKRAEANLWIGECRAARAALETSASEKARLLDDADQMLAAAAHEAEVLGLLEWPDFQVRSVRFAAEREASSSGNAPTQWQASARERVQRLFNNPPQDVSPAKKLSAVQWLCGAAKTTAAKIQVINEYLPNFRGDDQEWRLCRLELQVMRGELRLGLSRGEWDTQKRDCRTDAEQASELAGQIDEQLVEPAKKLEFRRRTLDLEGNYFCKEFERDPATVALLRQAEAKYQEVISLSADDPKTGALVRFRWAQMLKLHIVRNGPQMGAAAATQIRQQALSLLVPITQVDVDDRTYHRVEDLRRWFNE